MSHDGARVNGPTSSIDDDEELSFDPAELNRRRPVLGVTLLIVYLALLAITGWVIYQVGRVVAGSGGDGTRIVSPGEAFERSLRERFAQGSRAEMEQATRQALIEGSKRQRLDVILRLARQGAKSARHLRELRRLRNNPDPAVATAADNAVWLIEQSIMDEQTMLESP